MQEEVREGVSVGVAVAVGGVLQHSWILCLEALFKTCPRLAGILGEGLYRTAIDFSHVSFFHTLMHPNVGKGPGFFPG